MWDDYEYMSWSERVVNAGAAILGGVASFAFFCLSNLRVIAAAVLASLWFSAYWTMMHPKPPVPAASRAVTAPAQAPCRPYFSRC